MPSGASASWGRRLLVLAGLVAIAATLVLAHVKEYPLLSPIDELQHIDYLDQASRFDLVEGGERVHRTAMREQSCRGIDSPGFVSPPCAQRHLDPAAYQESGFNTAAADPPVYYYATGLTSRALAAILPGTDSIVTIGRSLGTLWLTAGLLVTFLLTRRLGGSTAAGMAVCLLVASTPAVLHPSATITSDAPALLVGGMLALVAWAVVHGRAHPAWAGAAALVATLVKVTSIAPIGLTLLFVLLMMLPIGNRDGAGAVTPLARRRGLLTMASVVAGTLVGLAGWTAVTRIITPADAERSPMARFDVSSIGSDQLLTNAFATVTPVVNPYVPAIFATMLLLVLVAVLNLLLISATIGAAWSRTTHRSVQLLSLSTLVTMLVAGDVFVGVYFFIAHAYVPIPARYALGVLPMAAAVLASVASQRRHWDYVLLGLGLLSFVVTLKNVLT